MSRAGGNNGPCDLEGFYFRWSVYKVLFVLVVVIVVIGVVVDG